VSAHKHKLTPAQLRDIGETVRRLRELRGWSQMELGARAKVAQSNISRLESGCNTPTLGTLYRLAKVFAIHPKELLP
jgi:transcriptional regulator with XRE-family HTH domain